MHIDTIYSDSYDTIQMYLYQEYVRIRFRKVFDLLGTVILYSPYHTSRPYVYNMGWMCGGVDGVRAEHGRAAQYLYNNIFCHVNAMLSYRRRMSRSPPPATRPAVFRR